MSGVAKRVKLSENPPVEFELDGRVVTGTVVRLEGHMVVERYGSERIMNLMCYDDRMVKREAGDDSEEDVGSGISISGRHGDNFELAWEGWEDDGSPFYFGTNVDCCFHCWIPVDKEEVLKERPLGNWVVPIYMTSLVHPDQRPCQGCRESQDGCICDELEDGRKC